MQPTAQLQSRVLVLVSIILCFSACASDAMAGTQAGNGEPEGLWRTEDNVSIVEIRKCGPSLCGYLVSFPPVPGEASLNAQLCNLQILGGFSKGRDGRWVDGWIAALEEDAVYQATLRAALPDRLEVRAYVENERDGETVIWSRHSGTVARCNAAR